MSGRPTSLRERDPFADVAAVKQDCANDVYQPSEEARRGEWHDKLGPSGWQRLDQPAKLVVDPNPTGEAAGWG